MGDDERIAYLAGDETAHLSLDERGELDSIRALLAEPAVWAEPDPALEDRVVAAIGAAQVAGDRPVALRSRRHWIRNTILGVAAALILTAGIVSGLRQPSTSAQTYAADLHGTALAADAGGSAELTQTTSGWRIVLHANGLPRRDGGEFYEAWLKNSGGVLVPIGTFNEAADVTLWAGVSPGEFSTMSVTRQQADGGQASSGQVVLAGTAHRTN